MKRIAYLGTAWLIAVGCLLVAVGESRGQGGGSGFVWAKFTGLDSKEYEQPRFVALAGGKDVFMEGALGYYTVPQKQTLIQDNVRFRVFKEVDPNVWPETPQQDVEVTVTLVKGSEYKLNPKLPMPRWEYPKGTKLKVEFKVQVVHAPPNMKTETLYLGTKIITAEEK